MSIIFWVIEIEMEDWNLSSARPLKTNATSNGFGEDTHSYTIGKFRCSRHAKNRRSLWVNEEKQDRKSIVVEMDPGFT
jgi:hypothetical protein